MGGQSPIQRPETFEDAIDRALAEMRALMISKNRDYGPGNISAFGEFGVVVRAGDKVHRLANLLQSGKQPEHEKIEDTWMDLATTIDRPAVPARLVGTTDGRRDREGGVSHVGRDYPDYR